ncbi:imelysin family protein [Aestuariispira insulae]|uniref:Imelysin-like domain-containing protein n=1 Tax=Aestuariispira insulae TaxID=1461337 RepID=A0A3D9HJK4_9PROT|nr:imelysin family protein [Aestuariispira insulae]RED49634.1 hypothetical protein DFP90_1054 [Aestuariispira insulae]
MLKNRFLVPALAMLASGLISSGANAAFSEANRYMVMDQVVPGYEGFAKVAHQLKETVADQCGFEDQVAREKLMAAYQQAMLAWQAVQHVRFGPIEYADRQYRIQFWPDKRNRTAKALAKLKAEVESGRSFNIVDFAQTSVAVQGFPALERIFTQDDLGPADCIIANHIAENIALISSRLSSEWAVGEDDGFADQILQADVGTDLYKDDKEAAFQFFKSFQTGLQVMAESKLIRPLGESAEKARPKRAEAWRTGQSARYLLENATALARFYGIQNPETALSVDGAEGFSAKLRADDEGGEIDHQVRMRFEELIAQLKTLDRPLSEMVADDREPLEIALKVIGELRQITDGPMAEKLGFFIGFNNLDGD